MMTRVEQMGVSVVVAFAAAVIVAYSFWGASVLQGQREAAFAGAPQVASR
jgi:hypothetical protein